MINPSADWSKAVNWARDYIESRRYQGRYDLASPQSSGSELNERIGRAFSKRPIGGFEVLFDQETSQRIWDENVTNLIELSKTDPRFLETLRLGIADQLEANKNLHPKLVVWLIGYLRAEYGPVKGKPGRREASRLHRIVVDAIQELVDSGWKATRNDETSSPTSACDILAEALRDSGLTPTTFKGVKGIWLHWLKTRIIVDATPTVAEKSP